MCCCNCCLILLLTRTVIIFLIFSLFPTPILLSHPRSEMFNLVWNVFFGALLRKAKEVSSWCYKARKWYQSTLLCLTRYMLKLANNEVEPLSEAGSTLPPKYLCCVYWWLLGRSGKSMAASLLCWVNDQYQSNNFEILALLAVSLSNLPKAHPNELKCTACFPSFRNLQHKPSVWWCL